MLSTTGLPAGLSYAVAAALAVTIDFPLDAAVKRSMAASPDEKVRAPLAATWHLVQTRRWRIFNGLLAKVAEFSISYCVTGLCGAPLVRMLDSAVTQRSERAET